MVVEFVQIIMNELRGNSGGAPKFDITKKEKTKCNFLTMTPSPKCLMDYFSHNFSLSHHGLIFFKFMCLALDSTILVMITILLV